MIRIVLAVGVLSQTTACTEEHRYARQYSLAICSALHACAPGLISLTFGDEVECRTTVRKRMRAKRQDANCTLVPQQARECIDALETRQCARLLVGEEPEACTKAYHCDPGPRHYTGLDDSGR